MTSLAKSQPASSLLDGYNVNGLFDEMFGRDGDVLKMAARFVAERKA